MRSPTLLPFCCLILALLLLGTCNSFAASPQEEARLLAAVKKAFETKNAKELLSLYYWSGVTPGDKQKIEESTSLLLEFQDRVLKVKFSPAAENANRTFDIEGKKYGPNLVVTQQIEVVHSENPRDSSSSTLPVAEKDGKLYLPGMVVK